MPSVEERVAYLEGRSDDHAAAIGEVRADIRDVRADIRDLRGEMIQRFERIDHRFEHVDGRFEQIDRRFEQSDRRFMWLVGLQFATLLAVVSAVLGAYYR